METTTANTISTTNYAGFWLRFIACFIDGILVGAVYWVAVMPIMGLLGLGMANDLQNIDPENQAEAMAGFGAIMAMAGISQLFYIVVSTLYYAFMESSSHQASVGK